MTSEVFVWAFPAGAESPVVAGVLADSASGRGLAFRYARSYLDRQESVSLGPDLPLGGQTFAPATGHDMPSTIRDAMPDSWGRRVINRELGGDVEDVLTDAQYMLASGSDRVGAVDFQASASEYHARPGSGQLTLISESAADVDDDRSAAELTRAVRNTLTAAGGSQPKAYVRMAGKQWLAKFPTSYDQTSPLIKAERAALHIAAHAGIDVPRARLVDVQAHGRRQSVLLIERFDREGEARRMVVSGLTVAGEHRVSGASYPVLVSRLAAISAKPSGAGRELFRRLAFRIAMRIDDDHLRNVAFFWDGRHATYTPAFDLSPDLIADPNGLTDIGDGSREFSLAALIGRAHHYGLERAEAKEIAQSMVEAIVTHRADAAEVAQMTTREVQLLMGRTATPSLIGSPVAVSGSTQRTGQPRGRTTPISNSGSFTARTNTPAEGRRSDGDR